MPRQRLWIAVMGLALTGFASAADLTVSNAVVNSAASGVSERVPTRTLLEQAQALQSESKWKEVVPILEQAYRQDPTNEAVIFGLGTTYSQVGRYRDGLKLLLELLQKVPDHPSVQNNVAWIYAKATDPDIRDPQKALIYARRALMTVPSDYNVWNTLAEAYYAQSNYQRALRVARVALQLGRLSGDADLAATRELVQRCRTAAGLDSTGDAGEKSGPGFVD